MAVIWLASGAGLIFALAQLPSRLDTMLFFSTALENITMGLMKLSSILQVILIEINRKNFLIKLLI